jgi:hypothetical protein
MSFEVIEMLERKVILTISELREVIMEAWLDGWHTKSGQHYGIPTTDERRVLYTAETIQKL